MIEELKKLAAAATPAMFRHVKRGGTYALIGVGKMQAENWIDQVWSHEPQSGYPPRATWSRVDMRDVAIYRSVDDGKIWVRPVEEFVDGRFELVADDPAARSAIPALIERVEEADAIIEERDDRLALVDRIADLIGLPHDQELDQVEFELWFSAERERVERAEAENARMREALERLPGLTPVRANARTAGELHKSVKAIAETALSGGDIGPEQPWLERHIEERQS